MTKARKETTPEDSQETTAEQEEILRDMSEVFDTEETTDDDIIARVSSVLAEDVLENVEKNRSINPFMLAIDLAREISLLESANQSVQESMSMLRSMPNLDDAELFGSMKIIIASVEILEQEIMRFATLKQVAERLRASSKNPRGINR